MTAPAFVIKDGTEADGGTYLSAGAVYSECDLYRYLLWRQWAEGAFAMFLMLNPSTATHLILDPTLRRCKRFAQDWGYAGFVVANLFAFRATAPKDMKAAADPVGPGNDEIVITRARRVLDDGGIVVAGWGASGDFRDRCYTVRGAFRSAALRLHYLKLTAGEQPQHPLYLKKDLRPRLWP